MNIYQTNIITIFYHAPYIYWFITITVGLNNEIESLAHQNVILEEEIAKTKHTYQNFIFRDLVKKIK